MPVEFLTDAKGKRLRPIFPATVSDAQLAEYFHAAADEEAILLERRMDPNRLGFAIQLGTVRFLGTFVADPAHVPRAVVEPVAAQARDRRSVSPWSVTGTPRQITKVYPPPCHQGNSPTLGVIIISSLSGFVGFAWEKFSQAVSSWEV